MKKSIITLMIAGLIGMGTLSFANEQKPAGDKAQVEQTAPAESAAEPVQIKGVVEKTESGLTLFDGKVTYRLKGDVDLESLVGKVVEVSGTLDKDDAGSVLLVEKAAESK